MIKKISDYLRRFPTLRAFIIKSIYYIECIIFRMLNVFTNRKNGFLVDAKRITPKHKNCFYGYYDKSPYSLDGKRILYHEINGLKPPKKGESAKIFLHDIESGNRIQLGETLAWNLQQGAMLRFYNKDIIVWNDYIKGKYCSVFYNLIEKCKNNLDFPLYDISKKGDYGLSLEFERLNIDAEGYGYIQEGKTIKDFKNPAYISIVDIYRNSERIIITSESLNNKYPVKHKDIDFYYFNHLCFNPVGNRFLFIERYEYNKKRYSRLFSSDLTGCNIRLLAEEDMVSHFAWIDNESFIVFCRYKNVDAYYILKDEDNPEYFRIENKLLMKDGHPTFFTKNGANYFLSDTYPLKDRYRELFIYNFEKDKRLLLARLSSPIKYDGPVRCDLHPRLNKDCTYACIDSIHEGFRGVYQVKLRD